MNVSDSLSFFLLHLLKSLVDQVGLHSLLGILHLYPLIGIISVHSHLVDLYQVSAILELLLLQVLLVQYLIVLLVANGLFQVIQLILPLRVPEVHQVVISRLLLDNVLVDPGIVLVFFDLLLNGVGRQPNSGRESNVLYCLLLLHIRRESVMIILFVSLESIV